MLQTYNTRHRSLKQKPFFLNFLENFLHSLFTPWFSRIQMCTSPSPMLSYAYFGALRRQFCLWNQESCVLESGIQLKKSGISLMFGIQNPSSTDKYWTPAPGIRNLESKTVLDSPYNGAKRQQLHCLFFLLANKVCHAETFINIAIIVRKRSPWLLLA